MSAAAPVLLAGAWDEGPGYPRTTALRQALQAAGYALQECRLPGAGADKRRLLRQPWRWPAWWWQQRRRRRDLAAAVRAAVAASRPRCVVVPYPGHLVVRDVARAAGVPVVLDLFLSAYDTVVEDRRLVAPGSLLALAMQRLDARACAAADLVLLDTPENAAYVAALTGLPGEHFGYVPVGDPDAAAPRPYAAPADGRLRLLFFGTGVPLHGLGTLLAAVAACPAVELTLVGGTAAERTLARQRLGGRLVLEPEFVPRERLQQLLDATQLVAGVFGRSGKAQRVVPLKVVLALAAGRPVLTAETPAACRWLDGSGAAFFAPAGDAAALAAVLGDLAAAPARLAAAAAAARPAYDRHFGAARSGARCRELLDRLPAPGSAR